MTQRVLIINAFCGNGGSTGRICAEIAQEYEIGGYEVKVAYGRIGYVPEKFKKYAVRIGNDVDVRIHGIYTRFFDRHGFASKRATEKFLRWADGYNPDLLWLHNIHGYFVNIEMLFEWIKSRPQMQVKWTLHDCWTFTGHCAYFTMAGCNKWQTHCENCPQKKSYPATYILDNCYQNYERKKAAFTGVKNLTLITPSKWLSDLVKESFLREYPVEVCHNKIDTNVFKPTKSDFREKRGLTNKKIILGVASEWDKRKGLKDFIELSEMLDNEYQIVLVGLNKKQLKEIPSRIIGIQRTESAEQLAGLYTTADVFVNPTYEDNYPTVNLEAQACGTPVITYRTGGSVESVLEDNIVEVGDVQGIYLRIKEIKSKERLFEDFEI